MQGATATLWHYQKFMTIHYIPESRCSLAHVLQRAYQTHAPLQPISSGKAPLGTYMCGSTPTLLSDPQILTKSLAWLAAPRVLNMPMSLQKIVVREFFWFARPAIFNAESSEPLSVPGPIPFRMENWQFHTLVLGAAFRPTSTWPTPLLSNVASAASWDKPNSRRPAPSSMQADHTSAAAAAEFFRRPTHGLGWSPRGIAVRH